MYTPGIHMKNITIIQQKCMPLIMDIVHGSYRHGNDLFPGFPRLSTSSVPI